MTDADQTAATKPPAHPMHNGQGMPITAIRMRQRVAEVVGDPNKANLLLDELAFWAYRCAEVKHEGGDTVGSDKAMWMYAVLSEPDDDAYSDGEETKMTTINGVPADQWGTWCRHGKHVVLADPNREPDDQYPTGVIAEPWPCDAPGCTAEQFAADMQTEADAYEAERWAEVRSMGA